MIDIFKKVFKEFVFEKRLYGSCHASTAAVLDNGDVIVAWFAGSKEGEDDVRIYCARRVNGVFEEPFKIADSGNLPHWNPVLLTEKGGRVHLFYKVGRKISEWYTMIMSSDDGGRTWSEPRELVKGDRGGRGPVRNKVIILSNGDWIAPASTENGIWQSFADISKDGGKTWTKSNYIKIKDIDYSSLKAAKSDIPVSEQSFTGRGVIQPTMWESKPGHVHMLMRSSEGRIFRSDSKDFGATWSDPYPTGLPNNNSGIDVAKLSDGTLVLAYNPVGENWGPRTPICLVSSRDNGATWQDAFVMDEGPGEFSYPCVNADGTNIYVTYTWKRETIAFWKLALER